MSRGLTLVVACLGVALVPYVIPGLFTIDETNHLAQVAALRSGSLHLPGYDGVAPSPELYFFDPLQPATLRSPPENRLPPLYGVLAYPFSFAGVAGLFYLNVLGFVVCLVLMGRFLTQHGTRASTPWIGLGLFAFGSFTLEYALGLWPHMLSAALVLGAFMASSVARSGRAGAMGFATLAGLLAGLAAGVRYQNVLFVGALALASWLWGERRDLRRGLWVLLGAAGPLLASALINHARIDSANPISKGGGYLQPTTQPDLQQVLADVARSFAARVWDMRLNPPQVHTGFSELPDPASGAYLWFGIVKKALVQSAPWTALAVVLCVGWLSRRPLTPADARRRELRSMALCVMAVLGAFAAAGTSRTSGLCFNPRYMIDLLPLMAMGVALWLERTRAHPVWGLAGLLVAGLFAWHVVARVGYPTREIRMQEVPLWIGAACVVGAGLALLRRGQLLWAALGAALAWALVVHLHEDVQRSRWRRRAVAQATDALRGRLPDAAVLFVWTSYRNAASPLLLEQPITLVEPSHDDGVSAPRVAGQFLAAGRRVFVLTTNYPGNKFSHLLRLYGMRDRLPGQPSLVELGTGTRPAAR